MAGSRTCGRPGRWGRARAAGVPRGVSRAQRRGFRVSSPYVERGPRVLRPTGSLHFLLPRLCGGGWLAWGRAVLLRQGLRSGASCTACGSEGSVIPSRLPSFPHGVGVLTSVSPSAMDLFRAYLYLSNLGLVLALLAHHRPGPGTAGCPSHPRCFAELPPASPSCTNRRCVGAEDARNLLLALGRSRAGCGLSSGRASGPRPSSLWL